jgi:ATP/maltotriose-dependent transcriptional regulator MalT
MSYPGIAGQLFVSCGTVKSRARHVYRKVGVPGREQAVSPAVSPGRGGSAS